MYSLSISVRSISIETGGKVGQTHSLTPQRNGSCWTGQSWKALVWKPLQSRAFTERGGKKKESLNSKKGRGKYLRTFLAILDKATEEKLSHVHFAFHGSHRTVSYHTLNRCLPPRWPGRTALCFISQTKLLTRGVLSGEAKCSHRSGPGTGSESRQTGQEVHSTQCSGQQNAGRISTHSLTFKVTECLQWAYVFKRLLWWIAKVVGL